MSRIGPRDTEPEIAVRRYLHAAGLRFGLHNRKLPGRPDLSLPKYRTVVFVHGCFWHRHKGCRFATTPASNRRFWAKKFEANVRRDSRHTRELCTLGWQVLLAWACELDDPKSIDRLFWKIVSNRSRE